MKTLADLANMKDQSCSPFNSAYDFLIKSLEHYYLSELNGKKRIKEELDNWDKESKLYIVNTLIERIGLNLTDFKPDDLLELVL